MYFCLGLSFCSLGLHASVWASIIFFVVVVFLLQWLWIKVDCIRSGIVTPLALLFLLGAVLSILGLLWLHMHFKICLLSFPFLFLVTNEMRILLRIALNL